MNMRAFLLETFLFSSFSEKEIRLLEASTASKKVRKGEQIFTEGMEATAFFLIAEGKVKIYKLSPDGKEHTLHIHGAGDLVAEAAIFDAKVYPASCAALEESTLIRISGEGFRNLIRVYPELSFKMMSGYSRRLRQFVAKIEELSLKDIKARLAGYILEHSTVKQGINVCHLKYSKKEIASLLGTIPETLSRALAFLKQKKLIVEKEKMILVPDPEKLKAFSE
ncbi:MAG: Crp/Fnr family transcriptional regulator [Nitrospirota bacterium]